MAWKKKALEGAKALGAIGLIGGSSIAVIGASEKLKKKYNPKKYALDKRKAEKAWDRYVDNQDAKVAMGRRPALFSRKPTMKQRKEAHARLYKKYSKKIKARKKKTRRR